MNIAVMSELGASVMRPPGVSYTLTSALLPTCWVFEEGCSRDLKVSENNSVTRLVGKFKE